MTVAGEATRLPSPKPRGRWWFGVLAALALLPLLANAEGCAALGAPATGARRQRMQRSRNFQDGHFVNPQPIVNDVWGALLAMLHPSPNVRPSGPLPLVTPPPAFFATAPDSGLRVTWLGHSTTLVEIDGHRVLTDPVWSARASPVGFAGPKRWYSPPIALADLPPIDAVVISHDHYDHLDEATIRAMKDWPTRFVVPLGVGADLERWGIAADRIFELDWWEHAKIPGLEIVCTPARHASGRTGLDQDAKLWAGYAVIGTQHRVYYSGDSGLFPALREIGARLGPFDLTLIEIGQYDRAWPDWHMGPEQAVQAHQLVGGRVFLPVHWGAFALAAHGWTEPIERALVAAQESGVTIVAPRPGESVEPSAAPPVQRWWPSLPWQTAAQNPIVSSQLQ